MNYGLMKYESTSNLGDEIQSLAAARFLPQIDYFIDREQLKNFTSEQPVKTIMNGWFMHNPQQWPPSGAVEPLLTSMHINKHPSLLKFLFPENIQSYFAEYGRPVGARDYSTLEILQQNNIPAYFSGCLTLTLAKKEGISRADYICAVDISDDALSFLKTITQRPVYKFSPMLPAGIDYKSKFRIASILLTIYQEAHCVITGRLHAAMPCLALETPVLLFDYAKDQYRFSGLNNLVRHCRETEFLTGKFVFDLENPEPNSSDYLQYRNKLIDECVKFTGFDSKRQKIMTDNIIDEKFIFLELLDNYKQIQNRVNIIKNRASQVRQGKVWKLGSLIKRSFRL